MTFDLDHNEKAGTITCTFQSTNISKTVYHIESEHLEVTFAKGKEITYHPVDVGTHQKLMLSESIGKTFNSLVKANAKVVFFPGKVQDFITAQKKKRGY